MRIADKFKTFVVGLHHQGRIAQWVFTDNSLVSKGTKIIDNRVVLKMGKRFQFSRVIAGTARPIKSPTEKFGMITLSIKPPSMLKRFMTLTPAILSETRPCCSRFLRSAGALIFPHRLRQGSRFERRWNQYEHTGGRLVRDIISNARHTRHNCIGRGRLVHGKKHVIGRRRHNDGIGV